MRRHPHKRRPRVVAALAGALALVLFWLLFQPFAGKGGDAVRVFVPKQSGVGKIAGILNSAGVVSNGFLFEVRVTISGSRGKLKPGHYQFRKGMSYGSVLDALKSGPPKNIVSVVVPEGSSRREIAAIARRGHIGGNYMDASRSSNKLDPTRYGAPPGTDSLEGFLFPATYELYRGAKARAMVSKQLETFRGRFKGVDLSYARRKNLTEYDVLTIASMVEREAKIARERPLMAAVIYNRLKKRMPLSIDATIRYATNNWRRPLTNRELNLDSPYNTRKHAGLPPTPIGSPGMDSITAASRPSRVSYLYYVVKPGTCGGHAFASTNQQFERDRARYQRERERLGRSPTKCPK